jgi:hypothetical protein
MAQACIDEIYEFETSRSNPLTQAIEKHCSLAIIDLLLNHLVEADMNQRDARGVTPLLALCQRQTQRESGLDRVGKHYISLLQDSDKSSYGMTFEEDCNANCEDSLRKLEDQKEREMIQQARTEVATAQRLIRAGANHFEVLDEISMVARQHNKTLLATFFERGWAVSWVKKEIEKKKMQSCSPDSPSLTGLPDHLQVEILRFVDIPGYCRMSEL